jgi:hypothetical protein
MRLMQTSSTVYVSADRFEQIGDMELDYTCDGCEAKTGNPYANIVTVVLARDGSVVDDSQADGWKFFWDEPEKPCTRSYCPGCAPSAAA